MPASLSRRALFGFLAGVPMFSASLAPAVAQLPKVVVHKDPNCGCCSGWVTHLRRAGFAVDAVNTEAIDRVKTRLGVPNDLASCHTAEVGGYVIEGHVPAASVKRLLTERPDAAGLAVPDMPIGSPGMEVPGSPPEDYAVILFGPSVRREYARYRGTQELQR